MPGEKGLEQQSATSPQRGIGIPKRGSEPIVRPRSAQADITNPVR
jgi:hypothetical protein